MNDHGRGGAPVSMQVPDLSKLGKPTHILAQPAVLARKIDPEAGAIKIPSEGAIVALFLDGEQLLEEIRLIVREELERRDGLESLRL